MKWIIIIMVLLVVTIYACQPTTKVTDETIQSTTKVDEGKTTPVATTTTTNKEMSINL